jgi:hypothetical protein
MKTYKFYQRASKHFLDLPLTSKIEKEEIEYCYVASALLSWICLESYVNAICDSLSTGKRIDDFQRAFLMEKDFRVNENGEVIENTARPPTLKKLVFIIQNFSAVDVKEFKQSPLWRNLQDFEDIRNRIVHHRESDEFTIRQQDALNYNNLINQTVSYVGKLVTKVPRKRNNAS